LRPAVPQLTEDPDRPELERRRSPQEKEAAIRLLIVDDDREYCAWLAAQTRRIGFEIGIAYDGIEALEQLARKSFDLAVIDQEMPRLTGLELIERIRDQESTQTIYALMLTGRAGMDTKLSALGAGFDDFLSKSAPPAELVAKLIAARRIAARQRNLDATVRELYGLATRDELTGVFNRRFFVAEAERLLAARCIVNIVLFDLDNFKQVNDTYGHLTGDTVLRDIGALFHRHTRPEDLIARFGGDEFVMVVPHLTFAEIERITERLTSEVRALSWTVDGKSFSINATSGIASSRALAQPTLAALLETADRYLYRNKTQTRNPADRASQYDFSESDDLTLRKPFDAR
jgi:diguanylate cyclase (GGDEF)-like protein